MRAVVRKLKQVPFSIFASLLRIVTPLVLGSASNAGAIDTTTPKPQMKIGSHHSRPRTVWEPGTLTTSRLDSLRQCLAQAVAIEARNHFLARDDDRPLDQIRFLCHQR